MTATDPANPTKVALKTCAECRFHSTFKRKRIMDATGFDDQLMFEDADKDETVYVCRAPGGEHESKEIGTVAITCASWATVQKNSRLEELDRKIAEFEARSGGSAAKERE